jgi:hypothetical protein
MLKERPRLAILLLALVFVAGCMGKPVPDDRTPTGSSTGADSTSTTLTSTSSPPPNAPPLDYLAGVSCIEGAGSAFGVAGTYGETPPPGWESPPDEDPITSVFVQVLRCERVEWGALERPAHVLWEYHQSFTAPESCRETGTGNYYLATLWFDDPELVAQALRFGLPAVLGSFTLNATSNQGIDIQAWTWKTADGDPSTLTVSNNPPPVPVTFTDPSRFFWFNGNQVSYYANTFVDTRNQVGNPTAVGTMSEPMMYERGGVSTFSGTALLSEKASFGGTIHRFSDLECKNEIPPSSWF